MNFSHKIYRDISNTIYMLSQKVMRSLIIVPHYSQVSKLLRHLSFR